METLQITPYNGYIGIVNNSIDKIPSFIISDTNKYSVNILLLYPGSYNTLIKYLELPNYNTINIFAISDDIRYISDLYRIVMKLYSMGKDIHFHYPIEIESEDDIFKSLQVTDMSYTDKVDTTIRIDYLDIDENYSFEVINGENVTIISNTVTETLLEYFDTITTIAKEIHLPFATTLNNIGLTYIDLLNTKYKDVSYINSVESNEELMFIRYNENYQIVKYYPFPLPL